MEARTFTVAPDRLSPLACLLLKAAAYGYEVVANRGSLLQEFMADAQKDEKPEGWHILRKVVTVTVNQHDNVDVEFDQVKFKALVDTKNHCELCEVILYLEQHEVELWDALDESEYPSGDAVPMAECILEEARTLWNAS
jgi:hypothetical protein